MKQLISITLAILVIATSCTSVPEQAIPNNRTHLVKVKALYQAYPTVQLRRVDKLFTVGDTIGLPDHQSMREVIVAEEEDTTSNIFMSKDGHAYGQATVPFRDYQLEIVEDTIYVYDLNRFVGSFFWEDDSPIGKIIMKDNQ